MGDALADALNEESPPPVSPNFGGTPRKIGGKTRQMSTFAAAKPQKGGLRERTRGCAVRLVWRTSTLDAGNPGI